MELDDSPNRKLKIAESGHQQGQSTFWTVTRKLTLMTVVLTTIGFFIFITYTANSMRSNLDSMATDSYTAMADLLADSVTGAVRWNKASQVEPAFTKTSKGGESPLIALHVYGLPDNPKAIEAEYSIDGKIDEALTERLGAAKAVRSDDTVVDNADGALIITVPVKHEKNQSIIGHLVSVWDTTSIENTVWQKIKQLYLLGGFSVLLLAIVLGIAISRGIGRRIIRSVNIANEIAKGNLNNDTEIKSQDELGQLDYALNEVQISLKAGDDSERRAAEFGRIKQALDCATASTMLADENHTIVYTNDACDRLLADNAATLRINSQNEMQESNLIGQSLNLFSKFQGFSESEIVSMVQNTKIELSEGELYFQINITPVMDASGNRLGTVIEWLNRSTEVNAELEVQAMVDAASDGDFSRRIDATNMQGFYAQIAIMLNKLAGISEVGMNDILKVLRALASGQLDERIESDLKGVFAELRESSNATSDKLTDIVGQIREAAAAVNHGANEMAGGNQDLSSRTEQQAAHLQETAAAMSEMSDTVRNNSDSANKANDLANQAKEEAERGGQVTARAVIAVNEISEASRKISDIIGVIDNIAFQTNLLALNASVEAARAGDKGRGFAVVASEVRDLAGRSATAAKEIKDLIDDSVSKVDEGERLVGESGEALNAIVNSVNKVSAIVSDIASAGFEQNDGINQINISISRIDEMTQRNAALVEQASSTSQKVGNEANHLDELVKFFNTPTNKKTSALHNSGVTKSPNQDPQLKLAS